MSAGAIIALVIILALLVAAATVAGTLILRRLALRHRFGAEYDRLARAVGPRRAEAELTERRRRVARLHLRPLTAEQRGRYSREWTSAQERFVDSPAQAAETAEALVIAVAADRGYPADDHEQLLCDLSVHHARRLDGYRRARQTAESGVAKTEELRQALLAYRTLFRDLLGPPDGRARRLAVLAGPVTTGAKEARAAITARAGTDGTAVAGSREARVTGQATRKE
jgi:hypothetical protein